jgi:hypothetical protein
LETIRKGSVLQFEGPFDVFIESLRKTWRNLGIVRVAADIRTGDLLNAR